MNNSLWKKIRERSSKNIIKSILVISTIGLLGYQQQEFSTRGLNVVYGAKSIGIVRDKEEVMAVIADLEEELSEKLEKDIKIDKEISFEETHAKEEKITKKDDIKQAITEDLSYSAVAYAIKVDEKEVAYLETEEKAKRALEEYKSSIIEEMDEEISELKSIEVLEEVSLVKKEVAVSKINDIETTISKIKTGKIEEKKHIIEDEENFWTIALEYNLTMEQVEQANPEKDTKKLRSGDEIIVPIVKPLLTVATFEEKKIEEDIDFKIDYEVDENIYIDKEEVRIEGEKGKIEKEVKIERHNGVEISQEVVSENITKEPITQVIAKGTKEIPLGARTGSFTTPARGRISSPFGQRWGKLHGGIDIAAPIGEPIIASDGGTVTYSGFNSGGYGYMIDVNHGDGYVTRYAHCSKLNVENADKVNKGDIIAAVGNTGRSTGPHLHFEVRVNGTQQDPQNYLE